MVQTNLFKTDLTSPDPNTFKATYWLCISWERNNIQKPVNNRGSLYDKEGFRVISVDVIWSVCTHVKAAHACLNN